MNLGQFGNRPSLIRPPSFRPGGYLTPVSGQPVIAADATAVSTLFYTPDQHNALPIIRAGVFEACAFSEAALSLSGLAANNIYDLLAYADGRSVRFGWSPAWQSATAGAGARGSGLGTPELMRCDGLLVNANPILVSMNGASRAVPAGLGTYLASVSIGTVAGQVNCHRSYGQSRRWDVWNAYNAVPIILQCGDPTTSWVYNAGIRPSHGDSTNMVTAFCGLPKEPVAVEFIQSIYAATPNQTILVQSRIGIGVNSVASFFGKVGYASALGGDSGSNSPGNGSDAVAKCISPPSIGIQNFYCLEMKISGVQDPTFFGSSTLMMMSARWNG